MAAPTDPSPKWPEEYVAVLREANALDKLIPYYVGWVRRFFSPFPVRRWRELGRAEIETFLSETAVRPGISNSHVEQTRDAMELYYTKFRGPPLPLRESVRHDPQAEYRRRSWSTEVETPPRLGP